MDYKQFRDNYLMTHRASVPIKPKGSNSWLSITLWVLVYIGAAAISGVHTVPTIADSIPSDVAPIVAGVASLFGFLFLELALFTGALSRVESRLKTVALVVAFTAAVTANIYSAVKAFTEVEVNIFTIIVGVVLGFAAPLMALVSGETVAHLNAANEKETAEDMKTYRADMKELDAKINAAYTRHINDQERVEISPDIREIPASFSEISRKQKALTGNLRGQQEISEELTARPEIYEQFLRKEITAREIAEQLNTSPATLSKVFRKLYG